MECSSFKIGDAVIWHDGNENVLGRGTIVGIKFTSPMGNIYKVNILSYDKKVKGSITRSICDKFLRLVK